MKKIISLAFMLFMISIPAVTHQQSFSARYSDLNVIDIDDVAYISLTDLAYEYKTGVSFDPRTGTIILEKNDQKLKVSEGSRAVSLNGRSRNIVFPAVMVKGDLVAPAFSIVPLVSQLLGAELAWDTQRKAVFVEGAIENINSIAFREFSTGTLITIKLGENLENNIQLVDHNHLYVSIPGGDFNPRGIAEIPQGSLVRDLKTSRSPEGSSFSFILSDEMDNYTVSQDDATGDILISLFRRIGPTISSTDPPRVSQDPAQITPRPRSTNEVWIIDTVVIDPGHGGRDPGAIGPGGTREKDITLAIAKELMRIIEQRKEIRGVLTRSEDVFVPLHERASIAVRSGGKLFISIHANASRNRNARGMEVFFLSAAKTEDAKEVARRENEAALEYEENALEIYSSLLPELMEIQMDMMSSVYLKESQDFSRILMDNLPGLMKQENRGVKQAGFYVMLGTQAVMPSVLLEVGFISNPEEEKMLRWSTYQRRIAQGIYDSIITFKKRHEGGVITRSN